MDALRQYIDLYREHPQLVEGNSADILNRPRRRALEALENMALPPVGSEHYAVTDLSSMLAPDYGANLARVAIDVNPGASFHCGVPNITTSLHFLMNDIYASSGDGVCLQEGVFAGSLRRFCELYPDEASRCYGKLAGMENPVAALNTLLAQDGFVLRVSKGVKVEKPVQLVSILENGMPLMAVRRLLVIMEEGSEARLLVCDHTQNPDVEFLALQTVEIFAGPDSRLDYYDLEESTEKTRRLCSLYLRQEERSEVLIDGMTIFNGKTRNEYNCAFAGKGASLRLMGMGIEDRSREVETYSRVEHLVPECHTDELFKYVVDDEARGSFEGLVYVAEGAEKTEAYQSNRNIVGSDTARMFSKPQLEVYNDDVKCSHGSAIGQLDAMQVFYMRTRGLSEATARLLLKQAFMADVIDGVRLEPLRERLRMMVERRFAGEEAGCRSCSGACMVK